MQCNRCLVLPRRANEAFVAANLRLLLLRNRTTRERGGGRSSLRRRPGCHSRQSACFGSSQQGVEEMRTAPIGHFRSCFSCRNGCPRQGALTPTSIGRVHLENLESPDTGLPLHFEKGTHMGQALKGLEDFSHVWLLWAFHNYRSLNQSPRVKPPRLDGKTLG